MRPHSLALALVLGFALAASSPAQTAVKYSETIPQTNYEIVEQPDSPIALSIEERADNGSFGITLKLINSSTAAPDGIVLYVKSEGLDKIDTGDSSYIGFLSGKTVGPGYFTPMIMKVPIGSRRPSFISIDYIHFTDGRTWGADSLGRSKNVLSFLQGRDLAISRLRTFVEWQDNIEVPRAFSLFHSSSFTQPVTISGRRPLAPDFFSHGYDDVLNILRRLPENHEKGRALALRLEGMPHTPGQ